MAYLEAHKDDFNKAKSVFMLHPWAWPLAVIFIPMDLAEGNYVNAGLEVLPAGLGVFQLAKTIKTARTIQAAETLTHNNGIFEALTEQGISGTTRSAHRAAANRALLQRLEADPQLNRQLSEILGIPDAAAHMRSGGSALRNPLGTEWHHPIENPNVMILLRRQVHRHSELQDILHPRNIGGFGSYYGK